MMKIQWFSHKCLTVYPFSHLNMDKYNIHVIKLAVVLKQQVKLEELVQENVPLYYFVFC